MEKRKTIKKSVVREPVSMPQSVLNQSQKNIGMEKILIENFVSLQKVMTNLAVKFDSLSSQISKLLDLFEISAKTLAEKDFSQDKKLSEKLDNILEQNKVIARGITLLHEKSPSESEIMPPRAMQPRVQMPMQRAPNPQLMRRINSE